MATLRSTGTALYNNIWFMNVILLVRSVSQNVIMSNKRSLGIKLADVQRFLDTVGLTALFMMIVYWLFDILAIVAGKIVYLVAVMFSASVTQNVPLLRSPFCPSVCRSVARVSFSL